MICLFFYSGLPRGTLTTSDQQGILDSMQDSSAAAGITFDDDDYGMINLNSIEGEPAMNTDSDFNVPAVSPWWASYASNLATPDDDGADEDDAFEISGTPFTTSDDHALALGEGIEGEEGSEGKWRHRSPTVRKTECPTPSPTPPPPKQPLNGFIMNGEGTNYDKTTSSYAYPDYYPNQHGSGLPDKQLPPPPRPYYPPTPAPKSPSYPSYPSYPSKDCCCDDHHDDDEDKHCTEHISTDWSASGHYEAKTKVDQEGDCCQIHTVMGAGPECYMPANARKSTRVTHSHHDGGDCGCCH